MVTAPRALPAGASRARWRSLAAVNALPARGAAVRELGLPLPPAPMPLVRERRPLKRWVYVGVYSAELSACAAEAWVGPLGQRFWAVAEPSGRLLSGRARFGSGGVAVGPSSLRVRARDAATGARVSIEARVEDAGPLAVESVSAHGESGFVWTRKRAGAAAGGSVTIDGRRRPLHGLAVVDETAGYHARRTSWRWSAGAGRDRDGRPVAWNLVEGVNDDETDSERTVWGEGAPAEAPPVRFADDLSGVRGEDGAELAFSPWATLAHRTRLGLVRSDYRQPFGAFSGTLPGGIELAEAHGVMERHDARW